MRDERVEVRRNQRAVLYDERQRETEALAKAGLDATRRNTKILIRASKPARDFVDDEFESESPQPAQDQLQAIRAIGLRDPVLDQPDGVDQREQRGRSREVEDDRFIAEWGIRVELVEQPETHLHRGRAVAARRCGASTADRN
jgi:hypothetical protein